MFLAAASTVGWPTTSGTYNGTILMASPRAGTIQIASGLRTVVHFGVGKGLVVALIPSGAREHAHVAGTRAFGVHAEPRFQRTGLAMSDDVGRRFAAGQEASDRLIVAAHIRVVGVAEHSDGQAGGWMELELEILGACTVD